MAATKPLLLFLPLMANGQTELFVCDLPSSGCTNGMFNQKKCECECISPFCPDINGNCLNPSNSCGGNPWAQCTRGEDCPWWVNPLKAESCTTGPKVPVGLWEIYNTETACCNTNFAYSETCDETPEVTQPTKHPTIAAPEEDVYEVIPIKFDVSGLPDDVKMRELKDEMTIVLKRILLRLADSIGGLKISSVEEKVVLGRNLLRALRGLKKDVTLYYNVYVVRDQDKRFGPLIIQEIRDSYDEVLNQIQTFTDTKYFGANLNMNWCTSEKGKFTLCANEVIDNPQPQPPAVMSVPTVVARSDPPIDGGGLPGWAIALIIIIVFLIICCIGYFVYASCRGHDGINEIEKKEIENDKTPDGYHPDQGRSGSKYEKKRGGSLRGYGQNRGASRSRPRRPRRLQNHEEDPTHYDEDDVQIVLADPQDPQFDDSFTINTYGTKKKRPGRDPTMYIPGQEDKPDPEPQSGVLMITDGESIRKRSVEDPPLKPKREPTLYIDGQYAMEDPPLKPKRDPTMFVEGEHDPSMYGEGASRDPTMYNESQRDPSSYHEGASLEGYSNGSPSQARVTSVEGYSPDPYGMLGIDEEEAYDDYNFKQPLGLDTQYMTGETDAEYSRQRRDPTFYAEEENASFRTQDPSVSDKSERPKKYKKKKKKPSRSSRSER